MATVISTIVSLSTHSVNHNPKQLIFKIIICIYIPHTLFKFPQTIHEISDPCIMLRIYGSVTLTSEFTARRLFFSPFRFTKFGIFLPYIFRFDGDKNKIHRATHTSMRWGLPLTTTRCIHSARCALFTNLFISTHQTAV